VNCGKLSWGESFSLGSPLLTMVTISFFAFIFLRLAKLAMNQVTRESNDGRESVALLHYVKINCHEHSITSNEVWKKKIKKRSIKVFTIKSYEI